jgi:glycerol-3-phosphate dehydrogenase (NAD(P)+)
MRLAVLGAGAWGTAIAISLARSHDVVLWARDEAHAGALASSRINDRYLPGEAVPDSIRVTSGLDVACAGAELIIAAVPTGALRGLLRLIALSGFASPVIWLCKGYERSTGLLPHEICAEELPPGIERGVLSGPSFAQEVARGLPAAVTLASGNREFASGIARILNGNSLRVYSSDDLIGVEVAGALKNVMAIAVGVCDGLGLGLNARAALITRGLAEITRLGVRLGGRAETFMGLAGAGDLILTCTGDLSRNRQVGLALARGEPLDAILSRLGHVAEGVNTAREAAARAERLEVDMPITRAVCHVIEHPESAPDMPRQLLQREPKQEH